MTTIIAIILAHSVTSQPNFVGKYESLDPRCIVHSAQKTAQDKELVECHDELLTIKSDSIFIRSSPVFKKNNKRYFSESDGGFQYFAGKISPTGENMIAMYSIVRCTYCVPTDQIYDSVEAFWFPSPHNYEEKIIFLNNSLSFRGKEYLKISDKPELDVPELYTIDEYMVSRPVNHIPVALVEASILDVLADADHNQRDSLYLLSRILNQSNAGNQNVAVIQKEILDNITQQWSLRMVDSMLIGMSAKYLQFKYVSEHPSFYSIMICLDFAEKFAKQKAACGNYKYKKDGSKFAKMGSSSSFRSNKEIEELIQRANGHHND